MYSFTQISTLDGLSSNTVNAIVEDRNGLVWFATPDGLNKFDGTNITTYHHQVTDSKSIPANEVHALHQDKKGRLWIGTGGGLCYYDDMQNAFISFKAFKDIPIRSIHSDHNGNVWVGSYSNLYIIEAGTSRIYKIPTPPAARRLENVWAILALYEDNHHQMWIGSQVGVYKYNYDNKRITSYVHNNEDTTSISNNYITGITQDQMGRIWFATLDGLNMLNAKGNGFRRFKEPSANSLSKGEDILHALIKAPDGLLWIGTENGVKIFDPKTASVTKVTPDFRNAFSLKHNYVRSIYISPKGIYWIGLEHGGVNKLNKSLTLFNYEQSQVFNNREQSLPIITSFAEYKKDEFFVGTIGGGLQLFNRNTKRLKAVEINSGTQKLLSVLSVKKNRNGILWIGTFGQGIFLYDPAANSHKQILINEYAHSISENVVFCIEEDSYGNIWAGTNGKGINVFNSQGQLIQKFNNKSSISGKLMPLNGFIRAIAEKPNGDIWLGSHGSGIAIYHPNTKSFSLYAKSNSGLVNDVVLSILHTRNGSTWIGTNGGLCLFNNNTSRFVNFTENNGLASNVIFKILEDKNGLLWLSTNKGISSFNPKTKKIKNYTKENGVQAGPFYGGSGIYSSENEIFFGGESGFNYFNPGALPTDVDTPPIILTELKVANNTINPEKGGPISAQINFASDITLKYGQNFSIDYTAINYTNPHQNQYSYRLLGYDNEWDLVGNSKTAKYTNLDPGSYIFEVRASNSEGKWTKNPKSIRIKVLPPWWRTIYAYITYALIVVSALYLHRRNSIKKLTMKFELEKEKLKAQELIRHERREAERLHEMDMMKIKFLTNLSHEFRTPISLILAPVDKLLSEAKDSLVISQAKMIKRNARGLLNLVNQLLDFRKMEEHELKLNLSKGNIIAFIREAIEPFQDLSDRKKILFLFETQIETLETNFDHDKVERIVFNLLSNAFKFTLDGGQINMRLFLTKDDINGDIFYIEVSDNGIGIPDDKQEKIFDRFFQYGQDANILNQGSGIGLSITKELVNLHGGHISVKSKTDHGTTFRVDLPIMLPEHVTIPINDSLAEHEYIQTEEEPKGQSNKPIILIVEDNEDLRFYLKDNLKHFYQIIDTSNGKEGWQKALSMHPQLIVSDISMPIMDGIELMKKIKADKRTLHIPVILLTALSAENEQIGGLEAGANDYLTKPFNFEILNMKIKNLLKLNYTLKKTYSKQLQLASESTEIETQDAQLLRKVRQYIDEKINDTDLSVEQISKHIGVSRGTLYRKILEITGLKPVEYIRSVKLDRAAELLEKSDMNVSQIAYMTGFGMPNYFARMFKAKFKMLPSEYANKKRNSVTV